MADEIKKEETKEEEKKEEIKDKATEGKAKEVAQAETVKEDEKPLDKMTVTELKEIAKVIPGVTGATAMKKEELLKVIKEYRGIEDEVPVKAKKKKVKGKEVSVKDLKKKVVQLKDQKASAREAKDRKKVDILRRRISRMKKYTRKIAQG